MEIILQQDVDNLGAIGDIVRVKPGYARNYLLPRGLAVVADRRNLRVLEHQKRVIQVRVEKAREEAREKAAQLENLVVEVTAKAGENGRLFGSITNQDLQKALEEQGIDVDRRRISLDGPIKSVGEHEASIHIGADVRTTLKVRVRAEAGSTEAKTPAAEADPEEDAEGAESAAVDEEEESPA